MPRHPLDKYFLYRFVRFMSFTLPLGIGYLLATVTGIIAYSLSGKNRRAVISNLTQVLGKEASRRRICFVAGNTFCNYSKYIVDYFRFSRINKDNWKSIIPQYEGADFIDSTLKKGKGLMLLTAHLGNWELGGLLFNILGYPMNVVTLIDEDLKIDEVRERWRRSRGIKSLTVNNSITAAKNIADALAKNEIVAMLGDRATKTNRMRIKFFGKEAYFPTGPAILSLLTGAPIVPGFVLYQGRGRYYGVAEEPIYAKDTGNREKDIRRTLEKIIRVFEKYIRQYPDQWYNFYPFWETRIGTDKNTDRHG
ncbi:lysophospholipid acyltransferase family protein [bacterium]|nr:lysophospholipid acyltransferase family protein [bacterium]